MKPLDPALLPHLRPARAPLAVELGAGALGGLLAVAQAWAAGALIVRLVSDPTGSSWHVPASWFVVVVAARAIAAVVVDVAAARAAATVSTTLRSRLLAAAADLDPLALSRHHTGALTALATRGMAAIEPYLTRYLPALVLAAVLPAASLAAIWWLDWLSGLIVVLTLPLVPAFAILIGLSTRDRADRQWREMAQLSGHFLDVVRGLPTLVAHRRAEAQGDSIRRVTDRHRRATLDTLKVAFASSAALELIATLSVALVAVVVGLRLASGGLDFETALIVLLLAPEAYWPWRRVGAEFHAAAEGTATFEEATRLLGSAEPTHPRRSTRAVAESPAAGLPGPVSLQLAQVGFTFPGRTRPALAPLSVSLPARGLVAVSGPSGVGKSTLLALVAGELRPSCGQVRVGGTDLAALPAETWRASVATAPQRPWLTVGTLAENLRIGRREATDDQLWESLRAVDLDDHVRALPAGLDTPLGEDGAGLSAGQRARLALARVVLAARPVVLLDEPSAHLDRATEEVLLRTLRALARDSLVLVVAHRDTVLEAADQVIALAPSDAPAATESTPSHVPPRPSPVRRAPAAATSPDRPARYGLRTGTLLGALSVASGVALTATAAWLITRASEHPPVLMLMVAIVGVRTFGLARPVLRYAERLVSHDAALRLLAERRAQVYDAIVPLVPGRLGIRRGDLLTSVVDDVDALVDEQLRVRQPRWTAVLVGLLALLLASVIHPAAAPVLLGLFVVVGAAHLLTERGVAGAEPAFVAARASVSARVEHLLHNLRQLEQWQATPAALESLERASQRHGAAAVRSVGVTSIARALVAAACGWGLVLMAGALDGPLASGDLSPAMTALLVMLPLALTDAFTPLVDAAAVGVRTRAAEGRLRALTGQVPAVTVQEGQPRRSLGHPSGALDGVGAGWGETRAFAGLDLDLPVGSRVGLVGPSGTGKSTVAALLLRFLDPAQGQVLWDGADARTLHPDDIRARVGLVDDDPYVFSSTVLENVRLSRPGADEETVLDALERAHLGPWIRSLPDGADTFVGEGHAHVSGGERARLALARALLADQPVLVLDEPTAHLDTETAHAVAEELLAHDGRTVLWITHTTIGLDRMDRVVSLASGADQELLV